LRRQHLWPQQWLQQQLLLLLQELQCWPWQLVLGCCLVQLQLQHSWGPPGLLLLPQWQVLLWLLQQLAWSLPSRSARPELMLAWLPSLQDLQQLERGSLWVQLLVMVCVLRAGLLQEQHQLLARVSSLVPWHRPWRLQR
jgi:hypothetical protein